MSSENIQLNVKQEKFMVRLTEWEKDCIEQCLVTGTYPGSMVTLAYALMLKISSAQPEKTE